MKNGSFDVVKDDDLTGEDWEVAPKHSRHILHILHIFIILHLFLSSMADEEKDPIITLRNKRFINSNSLEISASQR